MRCRSPSGSGSGTSDLNDFSWFDAIDIPAEDGAVFFAAGVFYYFRTEQVRALCAAMAERFPGGRLVFDAAGSATVKLMLKTWVNQTGIRVWVRTSPTRTRRRN